MAAGDNLDLRLRIRADARDAVQATSSIGPEPGAWIGGSPIKRKIDVGDGRERGL